MGIVNFYPSPYANPSFSHLISSAHIRSHQSYHILYASCLHCHFIPSSPHMPIMSSIIISRRSPCPSYTVPFPPLDHHTHRFILNTSLTSLEIFLKLSLRPFPSSLSSKAHFLIFNRPTNPPSTPFSSPSSSSSSISR